MTLRRCATALILLLAVSNGFCLADDLSKVVKACGKPDHDDSTLHDIPRPPLVTRFINYDRVHLQLAFLLNPHDKLELGAAPHKPYYWGLIGFINVNRPHPIEEGGDTPLGAVEAHQRLKAICKPGFVVPESIEEKR